jgi:ABC-type bacteriocin/lantibiotic exporter with double-glycine peptidase domain
MAKEEEMTIGKAKFLWERWRSNIGIISFFLVIRLNLIQSPIWWGWFVIGFVLSMIYLWIDLKYILPRENQTSSEKNPFLVEMMDDIKEIKRKLNANSKF